MTDGRIAHGIALWGGQGISSEQLAERIPECTDDVNPLAAHVDTVEACAIIALQVADMYRSARANTSETDAYRLRLADQVTKRVHMLTAALGMQP